MCDGVVRDCSGEKKSVSRSAAGPISRPGTESKSAKAENVVALLGKLCLEKACILLSMVSVAVFSFHHCIFQTV